MPPLPRPRSRRLLPWGQGALPAERLLPLLMLPALLLLAAVFLWPLLQYAWLSGQASSVLTGLEPVPNGGANWQRLFGDARFWQASAFTLRVALVSLALQLLLGLAMALVLHRPAAGRGWLRAVALLPWALPGTVLALGWRWIYNDPYGPLNALIQALGGHPYGFLTTPSTTWLFVVLADVWKSTPFVALLLLAGLQSIPVELEESLRLEGATRLQILRRLTLPLLRPWISLALLFRLAQALGLFDLVQVLTRGGPAGSTESLALYAYLQAMRFLDFGYSATVVLATFLLLVLLTLLGWLLLGLRSRGGPGPAAWAPPSPVPMPVPSASRPLVSPLLASPLLAAPPQSAAPSQSAVPPAVLTAVAPKAPHSLEESTP